MSTGSPLPARTSTPSAATLAPSVSSATAPAPSSSAPALTSKDYTFHEKYYFPPFFCLQPNPSTRAGQLALWSSHIQSYCRHHRLFALTLVDALPTPLFTNARIRKSLALHDARTIITWMASPEGGGRAEWIGGAKKSVSKGLADEERGRCWVYWRRPEEWAAVVEEWVERTGQKGAVLTLYELTESDATRREEFWGMDGELLVRSLQISVGRGKAQIFGAEGSEGVKFF